jgi:dephospho-CoA kinase
MNKDAPFCIGLTGNMGSGKSTVAKMFKDHGADILSADVIAKALTARGQPAYHLILEHFGPQFLDSTTQEINRALLRKQISSNPEDKRWLEKILHPLIRQEIVLNVNRSQAPYVIIEIPLLYNRAHYPYLHRILTVSSDFNLQIERIKKRDGSAEETIKALLASQPSNEERSAIADDTLINTKDLTSLRRQVKALHQKYLMYALKRRS